MNSLKEANIKYAQIQVLAMFGQNKPAAKTYEEFASGNFKKYSLSFINDKEMLLTPLFINNPIKNDSIYYKLINNEWVGNKYLKGILSLKMKTLDNIDVFINAITKHTTMDIFNASIGRFYVRR